MDSLNLKRFFLESTLLKSNLMNSAGNRKDTRSTFKMKIFVTFNLFRLVIPCLMIALIHLMQSLRRVRVAPLLKRRESKKAKIKSCVSIREDHTPFSLILATSLTKISSHLKLEAQVREIFNSNLLISKLKVKCYLKTENNQARFSW